MDDELVAVGKALLMSLIHDMNEPVSFLECSSKRVIKLVYPSMGFIFHKSIHGDAQIWLTCE